MGIYRCSRFSVDSVRPATTFAKKHQPKDIDGAVDRFLQSNERLGLINRSAATAQYRKRVERIRCEGRRVEVKILGISSPALVPFAGPGRERLRCRRRHTGVLPDGLVNFPTATCAGLTHRRRVELLTRTQSHPLHPILHVLHVLAHFLQLVASHLGRVHHSGKAWSDWAVLGQAGVAVEERGLKKGRHELRDQARRLSIDRALLESREQLGRDLDFEVIAQGFDQAEVRRLQGPDPRSVSTGPSARVCVKLFHCFII